MRWRFLVWAQIAPDHPTPFLGRIPQVANLRLERRVFRLQRHVGAIAMRVESPAMVGALKALWADLRIFERRTAVRAPNAEECGHAFRGTKRDEILSEQPNRIGKIDQIPTETNGVPVMAQHT